MLLLGFGAVGRELALRLSPHWTVTAVDLNAEPDEGDTEGGVRLIRGDASSRLVLERAGLNEAACVVASIGDDEVNLECCRLARAAGVPQVLALVRDSGAAERLVAMGVDPVAGTGAIASILHNRVERMTRVAVGVGLGGGEIVEITIMPDSPAVGRTLQSLGAKDWLVAAMYRKGKLHVPTGQTVIRPDDRLVLVGQVGYVEKIAELLRAAEPCFPQPYGQHLAIVAGGPDDQANLGALAEALALAELCGIDQVHVFDDAKGTLSRERVDHQGAERPRVPLVRHDRPADGRRYEPLEAALALPRLGCLVIACPRQGLSPIRWRDDQARWLIDHVPCPVLLARGSAPYGRLVAGVRRGAPRANWPAAAVALSRQLGLPLSLVAVHTVFADGDSRETDMAMNDARVLGQAFRASVTLVPLSGNPVRSVGKLCGPNDLLLLAHRQGRRLAWPGLQPDVSRLLARSAPCSTLIFPWRAA
ncbi:MAG: potassium channel family protein [Chloroflexota bacterium]